jgi:hypothetical protein
MSDRAPPNPTEERARLTEALIREQGTDKARWSEPGNLATQWDARAAMAAEWIPGGTHVLDMGAGAMALGTLLKPGCTYQPADVVARNERCLVADLNRGEFPAGRYDWITFLGVLEYVHDVGRTLHLAHAAADSMIATYCCQVGTEVLSRRGLGWVNDYDDAGFRALLAASGWRVEADREVKRGVSNIQRMYRCTRAA